MSFYISFSSVTTSCLSLLYHLLNSLLCTKYKQSLESILVQQLHTCISIWLDLDLDVLSKRFYALVMKHSYKNMLNQY